MSVPMSVMSIFNLGDKRGDIGREAEATGSFPSFLFLFLKKKVKVLLTRARYHIFGTPAEVH